MHSLILSALIPSALETSDKTFLLIVGIGCLSGLLIALQEVSFDWLLNKTWMGWRITLRKVAFSTLSLAILFGLGAYAIIAWQPIPAMQMSAQAAIALSMKIAILITVVTPISGQLMTLVGDRTTPNERTKNSSN